jgi:hypothetical protein
MTPTKFKAYWNGEDTWATRVNNKWFVGGDTAPGDEDVQILLAKDERPAWYTLRGSRLVFSDYEGSVTS